MNGTVCRVEGGRQDQLTGLSTSVDAWRQIMRIRRTILAQVILAIGTTSAVAVGPVLALTTTVAPAGSAVAASVAPNMSVMH